MLYRYRSFIRKGTNRESIPDPIVMTGIQDKVYVLFVLEKFISIAKTCRDNCV